MAKLKGCIFDWRWWFLRKNMMLLEIKLIWKKNVIASLSTKKWYLKTKIKSHSDGVTDFHDKNNLMMDSNHISLAVISLDSVLKKDGNYHPQVFLKGY